MAKRKPAASAPTLLNKTVGMAIDVVPTAAGWTLLAATGLFYVDAAAPVLNLLGTGFNNLATQLFTVAVEGALVVGALKSTLWGVGRIRKASELEKENALLREELSVSVSDKENELIKFE